MRKGFTLIELLLVIAIIGLLAFIVVLAINPSRNLAEARNSQRRADVLVLVNAVYQYIIDHSSIPGIPLGSAVEICKTGSAGLPCSGGIRLEMLSGTYLYQIPVDPLVPATATGTDYWVMRDSYGRVIVTSAGVELGDTILSSR